MHADADLVALGPRYGVYACLGNNRSARPTRARRTAPGRRARTQAKRRGRPEMAGRRVQVILARGTSASRRWEADLPSFQAAVAPRSARARPTLRLLLYPHARPGAPGRQRRHRSLPVRPHSRRPDPRAVLGALRTGSRFGRRYVMGLNRLPNGGYIYTSRGVGFEGWAARACACSARPRSRSST